MLYITRRTLVGGGALAITGCVTHQAQADRTLPTSEDVASLLANRIDVQRQSVGMAVGVVDAASARTVVHGRRALTDASSLPANAIFEIASVTKAFVGLLLADAARRGELRLDDALVAHAPIVFADARAKAITLRDLATHTSGLPNEAPGYPGERDQSARASYTTEDFRLAVSGMRLDRSPGAAWSYSNLGYQLLGEALQNRLGADLSTLVRTRITAPLGMTDTEFTPRADMIDRMTTGYSPELQPATRHKSDLRAAPDGLYSTAPDLIKFVAAMAGLADTPLQAAADLTLKAPRPAINARQGLGIWGEGDRNDLMSGADGVHPGFAASIAWRPQAFGVVVLSNSSIAVGDVARHLIDPRRPLAAPVVSFKLDPAKLDAYVGKYNLMLAIDIPITRVGDQLWVESIMGSPRAPLTPQSDSVFVVPQASIIVTFSKFANGRPSEVTLKFRGMTYVGRRK